MQPARPTTSTGPWTPPQVRESSAAIDEQLRPPDSVLVRTEDYDLVRFPDRLASPTFGLVQGWIRSGRPPDEWESGVAATLRRWGLGEVHWWTGTTTDADVVTSLRASGTPCGAYQLLARALDDDDAPSPSPGVEVRLVVDRATFDDAARIETEGWGRRSPDASALDGEYERTLDDLGRGAAFQVVAYVDGHPAGTGWVGLFSGVARILGAVTLPAYRRRGAYAAVVAERLRIGRRNGATLALTKARPGTSGPILQRCGFVEYDHWECHCVAVPR